MWDSIKDGTGTAWGWLTTASSWLFNLAKWLVQRLLGLPDLLLALAGIMPPKKLRIRVVILSNEAREPLASPAEAASVVQLATEVFQNEANTKVVGAEPLVVTLPVAAPTAALDVRCGVGVLLDDLGEAGAFFRRHRARSPLGSFFGYGSPVTVFVVRDIADARGCSAGLLADYVTVSVKALAGSDGMKLTLAHEVAHACDLPHLWGAATLMEHQPGPRTHSLSRWQKAIFRSSPHVTYG